MSLLRRQRAESSRHTRTMFITLVSWNPPWLRRHRRTGFVSLFLVRFFGRPVSVNPLVGAARAERHQHALACSNHTVPTLLSAYLSPTSQEARIGLGPCWVGQGRTTLVALLPCRPKRGGNCPASACSTFVDARCEQRLRTITATSPTTQEGEQRA